MSNRLKRVVMYVPHIMPNGSRQYLCETAEALASTALRADWNLTVLARPVDLAGTPVPWPPAVYQPLRAASPALIEPNSMPPSLGHDFEQLMNEAGPFDVLYLPSLWGCLPTELRTPIPARLVLGIGDLIFERLDFGGRTDRFRRELNRLVGMASGLVFGSETVRREVVERCSVDPALAHVIHRRPSLSHELPWAARRRYPLPERFILLTGWSRPLHNGLTLVRALAHLRDREGILIPLVGTLSPADCPPFVDAIQDEYAAHFLSELRGLGLTPGTDFIDLGAVSDEDSSALIASASLFVDPRTSGAGLSFGLLAAFAHCTPVLHSRIGAFSERMGQEETLALNFAPEDPLDLADKLRQHFGDRYAAERRAHRAKDHFAETTPVRMGEALLGVFERASAASWVARPKAAPAHPAPRDKRIAWLINHTTLRDAEVNLLRSLGFEVYTNKVLPIGEDFRSGSFDFSWDEHSTLPTHILNYLNQFNFYQTPFDEEAASVLNGYFGTVICAAYPLLIRELAKHFRGRIVVRVFGREEPYNYTDYFSLFTDGWLWKRLWQIQHRFWLGVCYDTIPTIEAHLLRSRSVLLPVALPERVMRRTGCWRGGDNRLFFVCPSIKTAPLYYGAIYKQFKTDFGEFPHIISGSQPIPVPDPNVTGFVTEDRMLRFYRELQVMYYHSREPRHIHYHPLEAIVHGMPVVYMRGGLMESFDKGNQAGACDTVAAARLKVKKVLRGDQEFIRAIQSSQNTIVETFRLENVRKQWIKVFLNQIMSSSCVSDVVAA